MPLFVVVLRKRTSYNKETKRKTENERSQRRDKKAITADSAPDPNNFPKAMRIFSLFLQALLHYAINN